MAVRLRLTRVGGKKDPIWRVVVADQRSPRDGRVIETIGHYNAQTDPSTIVIDEERARSWLARGAQPSEHGSQAAAHPGHRDPRGLAPAEARRWRCKSRSACSQYLAEGLVDDPEAVAVEQFEEDDGTIVLELCVAADDYGTRDRPRRPHRAGAALGRQSIGGGDGRATCSSTSSTDRARAAAGRWPATQPSISAGRVGRPHGLDGSFHVTRPQRAPAGARRAPRRSAASGARSCAARARTRRPIVRLDGRRGPRRPPRRCAARSSSWPAASCRRSSEGEWWAHELEGCTVLRRRAQRVGDGATADRAALVRGARGARRATAASTLLVPMVTDAVRAVDVEARRDRGRRRVPRPAGSPVAERAA